MYWIDIMTLFPDVVGDMLCESILGRGQERGYIRIQCHQIRDYTLNKQRQVDDYPYGGGRGAVMQADPLYQCWKHICDEAGERVHTIYMSPAGKTFCQADARRLRDDYDRLILVCGHYEGIDERFIEECVDEEISLGDFVMTGGEIPAMAVADAVCRLVPGVLSDPSCYENESHWSGMLEAPQYSRPEVWHDRAVPSILLSGNHAKVDQWRRKQSILRPSCSPATTPRWTSGGGSSPSSAPSTAAPTCTRSWTCPPRRTGSCLPSWRRRPGRSFEGPPSPLSQDLPILHFRILHPLAIFSGLCYSKDTVNFIQKITCGDD